MTNSKNKGKRGELELAKMLSRFTGRECRRGQQYCGANGDADVIGLPGIHIECKWVEKLNLLAAVRQADSDSEGTGKIPVVMHRISRGPWTVTMHLQDLYDMQGIWSATQQEPVPDYKAYSRRHVRLADMDLYDWCRLYLVWEKGV